MTHRDNWCLRINEQRFYRESKEFYKIMKYRKGKESSIYSNGDVFRVKGNKVELIVNGWGHTFDIDNNDDKLFLFDQFLTTGDIQFIAFEWSNRKEAKTV